MVKCTVITSNNRLHCNILAVMRKIDQNYSRFGQSINDKLQY